MSIFLVVASRDDRRWLVNHPYAGPAVFLDMAGAERYVDDIRATGVEYSVVEMPATSSIPQSTASRPSS